MKVVLFPFLPLLALIDYLAWNDVFAPEYDYVSLRQSWADTIEYWKRL